jgi:hypothetical protein
MTPLDYPSQRRGVCSPAEPMLLDTCAIQHMKLVMDRTEGEFMSDEDANELLRRYRGSLGPELVALGDLFALLERNGPPWVVAETSLIEFEQLDSVKGGQLRRWWHDWADYCESCLDGGWYPGLDVAALLLRSGPPVIPGQLALPVEPALWPLADECIPPLGPFMDAGDRALIRIAMRAGIPTILTTDLNSFWRHRRAAYALGVEIWRPTDLWQTLQRRAA